MTNNWNKQAINERLFNQPKLLNIQTLKEFIDNYPTTFSLLTDNPWQQAYLEGIKDVLANLEVNFLGESSNVETTLNGYLQEKVIINKVMQTTKEK